MAIAAAVSRVVQPIKTNYEVIPIAGVRAEHA